MNSIHVNNLSRSFSGNIAVDNVTFKVTPGAVHGLLGPNGAGKSTIMKVMAGLLTPTSGDITIGNFSVKDNLNKVKSIIGILPEHPPLYLDMTVYDYLVFVARINKIKGRDVKINVDRTVEQCGLKDVTGRLIGNLSKGYKQRVGIGQALVFNPQFLILDEPTVGLDPSSIVEIRNLIAKLKDDHTILLSSHLLHEIGLSCSEITIINKGKVVTSGLMSEINKRFAGQKCYKVQVNNWNAHLKNELMTFDFVKEIDSSSDNKLNIFAQSEEGRDVRLDLTKWLTDSAGLLSFCEDTPELEDMFFKLTSAGESL